MQRSADDALRLAVAVDVGGIEEVDAVVERAADYGFRTFIVPAPAEVVAPETDFRDL